MTIRAARPVPRVFATARFPRAVITDGHRSAEPASMVHAKQMGTMLTLCGESSLSWFKFWDLSFANVQHNRCSLCSRAYVLMAGGDRGAAVSAPVKAS